MGKVTTAGGWEKRGKLERKLKADLLRGLGMEVTPKVIRPSIHLALSLGVSPGDAQGLCLAFYSGIISVLLGGSSVMLGT